jgi:hypothetical protein
MKVLLVSIDFVGLKMEGDEDQEYLDAVTSLPKDNIFKKYRRSGAVDTLNLPPVTLRYDADCDAIYWWADLAIVAKGVTTTPPSFGADGSWDVLDGEVQIDTIDCSHGQIPVCFVERISLD